VTVDQRLKKSIEIYPDMLDDDGQLCDSCIRIAVVHDLLNQVAALFEEKERCRDRQLHKHGDKHSK
jgi:hypothetical protein